MASGWAGPPFDPIRLAADFLHIEIVATDEVADARTVPTSSGARIEFNPNRPRERRRYSVAHEIAHTLFPDCADRVRNRGSNHADASANDWQLETLCNIAAAEILMPSDTLPAMTSDALDVDLLVGIRPKFDVSMEAVIIRAVRAANFECAAFAASRVEEGPNRGRYRLEYVVGSEQWPDARSLQDELLNPHTVVEECTAIGYTAKNDEVWDHTRVRIECVGVPPFPWSVYPRVAGLLIPSEIARTSQAQRLTYVTGNALELRGVGSKILAHVVNDATPNWGGRGFATALRSAWPEIQDDFRRWAGRPGNLRLGNVHFAAKDSDVTVASMIAQRGFGDAQVRRLRYTALESALRSVAEFAAQRSATVHMPRIGTGYGGGSWEVIEELILANLCQRNIAVTIYDLPNRARPREPRQTALL